MRELALSFCYQLQSKYLDTASGEQVRKPHTCLPAPHTFKDQLIQVFG